LESIYKTDTGSDHVAKFRGDRPRELGDYAKMTAQCAIYMGALKIFETP